MSEVMFYCREPLASRMKLGKLMIIIHVDIFILQVQLEFGRIYPSFNEEKLVGCMTRWLAGVSTIGMYVIVELGSSWTSAILSVARQIFK